MMALLGLALAGCGRVESYRYKLTLAVDTPNGIKRASSVVEVNYWDISIPARGTMHRLRGEALYLDLGPGTRPLIALLTRQIHPTDGLGHNWSRDAGPDVSWLLQLYRQKSSDVILDNVSLLARMRGPHKIAPADLPDLVTFADVNNPSSVIEVDRDNLESALGIKISWDEVTLESTDEPVSTGLEEKLRWLPAYVQKRLDGAQSVTRATLANSLGTFDFDESDDLEAEVEKLEKAQPVKPHKGACNWLNWPGCLFR